MRTLAVALIVSFTTGCSIMKSAKIMKTINQAELVNTEFLYDLPFTFKSGLIIVDASIAPADGILKFIFDTGAYGTVTNTTASEYKLNKVTSTTSGDANQTKGQVGIYTIPSFKLGPLQYRNVGVVGYDHPPIIACLANGGIVGAPMMKDAVWQIDIRNKHIVVANEVGKLKFPPGTQKIKIRTDKFSRPFINLEINGKKQDFLLDLGATQLVDMPEKIASGYVKGNNVVKVVGQGYHGAWGAVQDTITLALLDSVQLFDGTYRNIPCSYSKKSNLPVIGSELLKYYVLTLDIRNEEIYLSRYADPGAIKTASFGVDLDYNKEGKVEISRIYRNSQAEKAGIMLGDKVTAINNTPVDYKSYCEFLDDKLKNFQHNSITLSIAGKEGTKQVSLQKETFLQSR